MLESFNNRGGVADNQQVTKLLNRAITKVFQNFSNISAKSKRNTIHKNQKPRSVGGVI